MDIRTETTVAELASAHPGTIRVFQKHGIDFCCGGRRTLEAACREHGIALADLTGDLTGALVGPAPGDFPWTTAPLDEVVERIVTRYHQWLYDELPRLATMMDKVVRVHGERHPELAQVARTYFAIEQDLGPHMMKEERVLFPYIAQLQETAATGGALAGSPFGTVEDPIRMMEIEHEAVGGLLAKLREQTSDYTVPVDACNTFRGLYHGLEELERELHEHIHVENNVLHPRAIALEEQLRERSAAVR